MTSNSQQYPSILQGQIQYEKASKIKLKDIYKLFKDYSQVNKIWIYVQNETFCNFLIELNSQENAQNSIRQLNGLQQMKGKWMLQVQNTNQQIDNKLTNPNNYIDYKESNQGQNEEQSFNINQGNLLQQKVKFQPMPDISSSSFINNPKFNLSNLEDDSMTSFQTGLSLTNNTNNNSTTLNQNSLFSDLSGFNNNNNLNNNNTMNNTQFKNQQQQSIQDNQIFQTNNLLEQLNINDQQDCNNNNTNNQISDSNNNQFNFNFSNPVNKKLNKLKPTLLRQKVQNNKQKKLQQFDFSSSNTLQSDEQDINNNSANTAITDNEPNSNHSHNNNNQNSLSSNSTKQQKFYSPFWNKNPEENNESINAFFSRENLSSNDNIQKKQQGAINCNNTQQFSNNNNNNENEDINDKLPKGLLEDMDDQDNFTNFGAQNQYNFQSILEKNNNHQLKLQNNNNNDQNMFQPQQQQQNQDYFLEIQKLDQFYKQQQEQLKLKYLQQQQQQNPNNLQQQQCQQQTQQQQYQTQNQLNSLNPLKFIQNSNSIQNNNNLENQQQKEKTKVIYARWFKKEKVTLQMIYNMFSNYGNIEKMIYLKEKLSCLIEYQNIDHAQSAKDNLNEIKFFGETMKVFYSNYNNITFKPKLTQHENQEEYFVGSESTHKFQFQQQIQQNQNVFQPCDTLFISNLSKQACNFEIIKMHFEIVSHIKSLNFSTNQFNKNSCLIQYGSKVDALETMAILNGKEIKGQKINITFAKQSLV